jgi:predicted transcriptional regulator
MSGDRSKLGPVQLEILEFIQAHQPVTVRQVADHLAEARGVTRTTALNMMERLRKRGLLTRTQVDGLYQYSPSVARPQFLRGLVQDFVHQALGGSLEPFAAYLAEDARFTDEDLDRLQQRIRELREQAREEQP